MLQALTLDRPSRPSALVRSAAVAFFATVTLAVTSTSAFAGANELAALNARIAVVAPGKTAATADSQTLVDAIAFLTLPANNLKKYSPAVVAGEALKASTNADAGTAIGAYVAGLTFPVTYGGSKPIEQKSDYTSVAIKTATTGKGLSVLEIPDFASKVTADDDEARALATLVKASKVAAGAVIQGRASVDTTLASKQTFAATVLNDKNLTAAIQEVTAGIAKTVLSDDARAFTKSLVDGSNVTTSLIGKNILKVIPGLVTGKPTDAGQIFEEALTNITYANVPNKSPIIKGAATLAKSLSAIADIEQVEVLGQSIAKQIATYTVVTPGKPAVPNIKLSTATGIVTTLAKAIATKPFAATGGNSLNNKFDELGELGAYFVAALSASPSTGEFNVLNVKTGLPVNADKTVIAIMKAIFTGAKVAVGKKSVTNPDGHPTLSEINAYYGKVADYVAGSISLTVAQLAPGPVKTAIQNAIDGSTVAGAKNLKAIAGILKVDPLTLAASVNAGKIANAAPTPGGTVGIYENGFDTKSGGLTTGPVANPTTGLTDPETNARTL